MSSKFLGLARTAGIQTCIWSKIEYILHQFFGLNGLSTLFLGIVVIRQIINGRNEFETYMAWLILILLQVTRQLANDYGIGAGYQMMAIGLHLIPIGLFTLILISKILNIILQSRLEFSPSS